MPAKRIVFFGRPGVGTTTVVANIGASLAEAGRRVAVIGCDAAGRSTASLRQKRTPTTLLEALRQSPRVELAQVSAAGFKGLLCLELGKAQEAVEIAIAFSVVDELFANQAPNLDYVLYDATGPDADPDIFVAPLLQHQQADQLVIVSTAEVDSLHAVNQLLHLLRKTNRDNQVVASGLLGNNLPAPYAEAIIDSFARTVGLPVAAFIPQSLVVTRSAFFGASVIDAAPLAHHSYLYRKAARGLIATRPFSQRQSPKPLGEENFVEWSLDWGERLFDLGEGYVDGGAAI